MAHTPLKMTIPEAHAEVRYGWDRSYSPEAIAHAVDSLGHKPLGYRINILIARLCFRGIYFPPKGVWNWLKVIAQNRRPIYRIVKDSFTRWHGNQNPATRRDFNGCAPDAALAVTTQAQTGDPPGGQPGALSMLSARRRPALPATGGEAGRSVWSIGRESAETDRVTNQFGTETLTVGGPWTLCVPSLKTVPPQ